MTRKRITPKDLKNEIKTYNRYLQTISYPHYYRNNANGGWQQLEIVYYPQTTAKLIERGTSRDCISALYKSYNQLYQEAIQGKLIITHVENLGEVNSKRETGNPNPHNYADSEFKSGEYRSAHKYVQNIMQSCAYWQIWYTLNGTHYTQTYNQSWK